MSRLLTGVRLTLGYVGELLATAARRLARPPVRPTWSIGDEARATFLRRFLRRLAALPPAAQRRELDSVPVLIPTALLLTTRRRAQVAGVPVTWISPRRGAEPRVVLYVHGGGFTVGSSHMVRDLLARLALASRARVLSVDYRLAPEQPWPAALEDLRAVWQGTLLEYGPKQLVVAGDSAGGNLVLALLCALRDAGEPLPAGAVLFSPWVDLRCTAASFSSNADVDILDLTSLPSEAAGYAAGRDPGTRRSRRWRRTSPGCHPCTSRPEAPSCSATTSRRSPHGRARRGSGWRWTSATTRSMTSRRSARCRARVSRPSPGRARRSRSSLRCSKMARS